MTFEPLRGTRVLDLTSVVVGPAATLRLAQYGAEIIKVESPDGDLMRGLGGQSPTGQHSGAYLHLNRGKKNICLNLKTSGARDIVKRLVAWADVVVTNMRPQALARQGLDPDSVQGKAPEKVYCLLTGYGTDGPYAGRPTYDSVVQGATGIAGLSLVRDGVPNYVPMLICDHVVAEIAAGAILAALLERARTGRGSLVEVPMFETMAVFVLQEHLAQQSFDPPVGPAGDQRLLSPHNRPVRTADGFISFTINTDEQVRNFLHVTDRSHLVDDLRFNSVAARATNVAEWFALRGAALPGRTTDEWLDLFHEADIASMPCHTLTSLIADPHLSAVGLVQFEDHPVEGRSAVIRPSIQVDGASISPRSTAAPKGWDTLAILRGMGYAAGDIEGLVSDGSVQVHSAR